jgi:uncharacterized membrane protein (UPF0127 family)
MKVVKAVNQSNGHVLCDRVEVADTSMRRLFGLLGRKGIASDEGLWIKPSSGVHTMGMMFPIDVVGLDQNRVVVKLWQNLVPYRVTAVSLKVQSVIEMKAGAIAERGLRVGDSISMLQEARDTTLSDAELHRLHSLIEQ